MWETIKSLPLTFYSRPFYEDLVLRRPKDYGFSYILILALFSFISACVAGYAPLQNVPTQIEKAFEAMPSTTVKNGKLSIDQPVPYSIPVFKSGKTSFNIQINTNYKVGNVDDLRNYMKKNDISILVTADKIAMSKDDNKSQVEIHDLSGAEEGVFTHDDWGALGHSIALWFYPLFVIVTAFGNFIAATFVTLFMSVIVKLLSLLLQVQLEFPDTLRTAAASGIPAGIVAALVPVSIFPKIILWAGYSLFALAAARHVAPRSR